MLDRQVVQRIPRFTGISQDAVEWLCERGHARTYAKGEAIFYEGDAATQFCMVLGGEVKVYKVLESGRELIMDIFRPGEAFGEVALVDGSEFPANAVAMEPSSVLLLARRDYLHLLERHPEVARSIIRDLTLRMHALRRRVEVLGESGVQSRIAQLLLVYGRQLGHQEAEGLIVPVHLSRQELAALVCARIETVIRIMSRWHKDGVVLTEDAQFIIPDTGRLHELVQGQESSG